MAYVVRDANERMERLIASLLALASSEAGIVQARAADLGRDRGARPSTARRPSPTAARCSSMPRSAPAPVLGDPVLLERLAENLIENAVRYNAAVGWVRVRTGIERGEAVLHVANAGARIDPGAVEELLEPFRRLESSRARVHRRLRARPGRRPRRGPGPRRPRRRAGAPRGRPRGDGLAADGLLGRRRADRQRAGAGVGRARPTARACVTPLLLTPLLLTEVLRLLRQVSGVSRTLRRDQLHVRRLLPLLVAAGMSLGVAACGSDSRLRHERRGDEVQRRQGRLQRRAARRGQEGRSSDRAGRRRRGLRRPGPDLLLLRLHDPLRGQPDAVLLRPRRQREAAPGHRRRRAADLQRPEDDHGQAQEGDQVHARRSTARSPRRTSSTASSARSARTSPRRTPRSTSPTSSARRPSPATIKDIPGIETPDDSTIVFKLKGPSAALVSQALAMPISTPVPEEYAKKFDAKTPSTYDQYVVFTGPYMYKNDSSGKLVGRTPGKSIELVRNPNWDRQDRLPPGLPGLDHDRGGQRRRGLLGAARPQGPGPRPGRRHDAGAGDQAGALAQQGPDRLHPGRRLPLRSR